MALGGDRQDGGGYTGEPRLSVRRSCRNTDGRAPRKRRSWPGRSTEPHQGWQLAVTSDPRAQRRTGPASAAGNQLSSTLVSVQQQRRRWNQRRSAPVARRVCVAALSGNFTCSIFTLAPRQEGQPRTRRLLEEPAFERGGGVSAPLPPHARLCCPADKDISRHCGSAAELR